MFPANIQTKQLYLSKTHFLTLNAVNVSFNPLGGVKGDLMFAAFEQADTGIYTIKLKNLLAKKRVSTDLEDGIFLTDYSQIIGIDLCRQLTGLSSGTAPADSTIRVLTTNVNTTDQCIYVYSVADATTPALSDIVEGDVLNATVYFKNNVNYFHSSQMNPQSCLQSTSPTPLQTSFFVDLSTPTTPTTLNAPQGTTVTRNSAENYTVAIPFAASSVYGLRGCVSVDKDDVSHVTVVIQEPTVTSAGVSFTFLLVSRYSKTPLAYNGVYFTLETTNGPC